MSDEATSGWGRTTIARGPVARPTDVEDVVAALEAAGPRGVLPRGLGRSYGDAALTSGGLAVDLGALSSVTIDDYGVVDAGAGAVLADVIDTALQSGRFVPVTPGTSRVTVGGCVAADVHGKNHHRDGSFGDHILSLDLVTADGVLRRIGPESDERDGRLFMATIGGMGLTGIVTGVRFRTIPVTSGAMSVDTRRVDDLDALMDLMVRTDADHRYSVAWIDSTASGRRLGRGVLGQGDHATDAASRDASVRVSAPARLSVPVAPPVGLINALSVRAFNEAWFRRAPRERLAETRSVRAFFHPLDGVDRWNRVYGPGGCIQYQFAVPDSGADLVRLTLQRLQAAGAPSFLSVLKRFGPGNDAPLSFPTAGWTLAVDLPATARVAPVLDGLDDLVAESGGRVYLAKDSRTRPATVRAMYPRLAEWQAVVREHDPDRVFVSDLSRRLAL